MKYLKYIMLIAVFFFISCDSCDNEDPRVILVNNGTGKADIQVKTSGGNTENINNIQPGSASNWRSFAPGEIQFTISIFGLQDNIVYTLLTTYCYDYTVTISGDNTVSATGVERE